MNAVEPWEEPLPVEILPAPATPLNGDEIDALWSLFEAISTHWKLGFEVELLRSRWLDMLEARSSGIPNYRGEYLNAGKVFTALREALGPDAAIARIYGRTTITDVTRATTRLAHAKFYVANDFIRCFVVTGGFRGFVPQARNYRGFMGGSRFREWDPVRTGDRR